MRRSRDRLRKPPGNGDVRGTKAHHQVVADRQVGEEHAASVGGQVGGARQQGARTIATTYLGGAAGRHEARRRGHHLARPGTLDADQRHDLAPAHHQLDVREIAVDGAPALHAQGWRLRPGGAAVLSSRRCRRGERRSRLAAPGGTAGHVCRGADRLVAQHQLARDGGLRQPAARQLRRSTTVPDDHDAVAVGHHLAQPVGDQHHHAAARGQLVHGREQAGRIPPR